MEPRSLISYWNAGDVIVLLATMASGLALLPAERLLRPRMRFISILGLWQAASSVVLFAVALRPVPNHTYFLAYCYAGMGENLLSILLAAQITSVLSPQCRLVLAWCGAPALLLAIAIAEAVPVRSEATMLNLSISANCCAGLVLVALLFFDQIRPPRSFRWLIAGVLTPASINAACQIQWISSELSPAIRAIMPMASLVGLLLLLSGCIDSCAGVTCIDICSKISRLMVRMNAQIRVSPVHCKVKVPTRKNFFLN